MNDEITIDPRDLIGPPFRTCPSCGGQEFGVLSVYERRYARRCRECWHWEVFDLPAVEKKVMYLDQLALSNMMFALDSSRAAQRRLPNIEFWRELFRRLDRLCKLNVLVCPDSPYHRTESLAYEEPAALQRIYELFAAGTSFRSASEVQTFQVMRHAESWQRGEAEEPEPQARDAIRGDLSAWRRRLRITFGIEGLADLAGEITEGRDRIHEEFVGLFEGWSEERPTFDEVFEREVAAYGPALVDAIDNYRDRLVRALYGEGEPGLSDLVAPGAVHIIRVVQRQLDQQDASPVGGLGERTAEYLASGTHGQVPCVRLQAMLLAALARQVVSGGRTSPPTRGYHNDVGAVAHYLPYCDAMFLDRECAGHLRDQPLRDEAGRFECTVFSAANGQDCLEYLSDLEASVSDEHVDRVVEVYGETWLGPFENLYA